MTNYIVLLDSPSGLNKKTVHVYLENDSNEHRQIIRYDISLDVNVDTFVTENFNALWNLAVPLSDDAWDLHYEKDFRNIYRDIVRAGVSTGVNLSLSELTGKMEVALLASDKAGQYNALKSLVTSATAAERNAFFTVVSYLLLSRLLSDD